MAKMTVDDIKVSGKKVLVRCDFNVPMKDGKITNDKRIVAALPTIKKLIADGGKVILCSHLGKPKNGPEAKFSLAPVDGDADLLFLPCWRCGPCLGRQPLRGGIGRGRGKPCPGQEAV